MISYRWATHEWLDTHARKLIIMITETFGTLNNNFVKKKTLLIGF